MIDTIFIALAGVIIIGLAGYAALLWRRVYQQKRVRDQQIREIHEREIQAEKTARENIDRLLLMLDQRQVSITEIAIRLSSYLNALPEGEQNSDGYKPFVQLAKAASHIPILDAWKKLSDAEQAVFEQQRHELEQRFEGDIFKAAQQLRAALK